jgi:hypothetical protein
MPYMTSILIQGSDSEIRLIAEHAKKLNLQAREISGADLEKFVFSEDQSGDEKWDQLSVSQQKGILDAIKQIEEGLGMVHEDVIQKYKKRYGR